MFVPDRPVEAERQALVAHLRVAAERHQLRAAALPERGRTVAPELAEAVAAERVQTVADAAVHAHVERVVVEVLAARRDEVVARAVLRPGLVRQRNQLEEVLRLRREPAGGNDVARETASAAPGRAARRIVDVDPVRAEIAVARRRVGTVSSLRAARRCCACPGSRRRRSMRSFWIGPPSDPPNWFFFVSGRTCRSADSWCACVNGLRAWNASFWKNSKPLPWILVGARLGLHRDHAGRRLAELGVVVLRGDLGLADRPRSSG